MSENARRDALARWMGVTEMTEPKGGDQRTIEKTSLGSEMGTVARTGEHDNRAD